jgi:hypothetical protein
MPITGPIPLPQSGADAFFNGATQTQNILSKILAGRQNQEKLQQSGLANKQLNDYRMGSLAQTGRANEQLNTYRMGELAIRRKAEARANQLAPYVIQQYKDIHGGRVDENTIKHLKALVDQHAYDQAVKEMEAQNQNGAPENAQPQNPDMAQPEGNGQPSLQDIMQPIFSSSFTPHSVPIEGMQSQVKRNTYRPDLNVQDSPVFNEFPQNQMAPEAQSMQPNQQQNSPQNMPEQPKEIVLRPSRKGTELQDKLAGTDLGKPLKYTYGKDGWVYTEYPGGKVTAVQNPMVGGKGGTSEKESPDIKRQKDIESKIALEKEKGKIKESAVEKKSNEKASVENAKEIKALIPHMKAISTLESIAQKKPKLSGKGTAFAKFVGMTKDPDVGRFSNAALDIQALKAKDISSRGSVGAANIVKGGKPDIGNSMEFNIGAIKDTKSRMVDAFMELKDEYEKLHPNQQFPHQLENVYKTLEVETPDGQKITLPTKGALKLLKDHPDHKIVG